MEFKWHEKCGVLFACLFSVPLVLGLVFSFVQLFLVVVSPSQKMSICSSDFFLGYIIQILFISLCFPIKHLAKLNRHFPNFFQI